MLWIDQRNAAFTHEHQGTPGLGHFNDIEADADEAVVVSDENMCKRLVFKVYGTCEECQRLLHVSPTKKDVGFSPTEVMYVMMPAEWSKPVDWDACAKKGEQ